MSEFVIRALSEFVIRNGGSLMDQSLVGKFLESYDPDAVYGFGVAQWTADVDRAMRFPSAMAAIECWRQQSTVRPWRDDGKANRPLTAYTIEPVPLDEDGQPQWPSMIVPSQP